MTSHLRVGLPTGYTRPTLQQILKADRQVFMCLIRIGAQLKRLPDNKLDLDSQLFQALQSYEVGFHLLPLPKACRNKCNSPRPSPLFGLRPRLFVFGLVVWFCFPRSLTKRKSGWGICGSSCVGGFCFLLPLWFDLPVYMDQLCPLYNFFSLLMLM